MGTAYLTPMRAFLLLPLLFVLAASDVRLPAPVDPAGYEVHDRAKVELGRLLFYDRVLSGDYRVSCASCHHHRQASSNGFLVATDDRPALDPRAAGAFLSEYRKLNPSADHAPSLFNLGHRSFDALFHDRRVRRKDGCIVSPLDDDLPDGIESLLAAQALVPAVTTGEQAGNGHGNALERATEMGRDAAFRLLEDRIADLSDYRPYFEAAYPGVTQGGGRIRIHHVANAIGAFVATEWRADDSPFDRHLRGRAVITGEAKRGMDLFHGTAGCAACHANAFGTDGRIHPAITPSPRFAAVRTPSLRNVARTGPWGHFGRYDTLDALLAAHAPKVEADERAALIVFLKTMTDEASLKGRLGPPKEVPSYLALD